MGYWALGFFVVAAVAASFGFSGGALAAAGLAKILFFVFFALSLVSLIASLAAPGPGSRRPLP
jgi:uncharacterized membrane protein YtjA (UPF0391 family)